MFVDCSYKLPEGSVCGKPAEHQLAGKRTGRPSACCSIHLEAMLKRGWELASASVVATSVRVKPQAKCSACGGPATELFTSVVCETGGCPFYVTPFKRNAERCC